MVFMEGLEVLANSILYKPLVQRFILEHLLPCAMYVLFQPNIYLYFLV